MFEKVNPSHPDKIADRIAGALIDLAYSKQENPKAAIEVLIGHGHVHIMGESSYNFTKKEIKPIIERITKEKVKIDLLIVPQDKHLASNQQELIRCGDNGIFRGEPTSEEESALSQFVNELYKENPTDGKFIITDNKIICCQSNTTKVELLHFLTIHLKKCINKQIIINPLGEWTGGISVDSGATNRKLGSDMGRAVTGGGLHGKDLSKADVTLNIYCHLKAQETKKPFELCCAIGDEIIDGKPYSEIVKQARYFINQIGGFEKFAEWGLIR